MSLEMLKVEVMRVASVSGGAAVDAVRGRAARMMAASATLGGLGFGLAFSPVTVWVILTLFACVFGWFCYDGLLLGRDIAQLVRRERREAILRTLDALQRYREWEREEQRCGEPDGRNASV